MGILSWLRNRQEFNRELHRRTVEQMRREGGPGVFERAAGVMTGMGGDFMWASRVQAQVTAAGLLMLALRDPEWLERWLAEHELKAYTSHTIANKDRLRLELARIRQQGWSVSEQQLELNYRGIGVPLLDRHGELVGALSVTMPMGHESSEDAVGRVLAVLQETARAMRNLL